MKLRTILLVLSLFSVALAQPSIIQETMAKNKQILAKYSWQEVQTLSLDGEVKQTTISQVQLGSDGKPVKTLVSEQKAPPKATHGPLRKRIRERKVEEFKDYTKSVVGLAQEYAHPDADKLKAAFAGGNLEQNDVANNLATVTLKNYLKDGDCVVITYQKGNHRLQSLQVDSYLDDPDQTVKVTTQFAAFPDGQGSHVSQSKIEGQKKDLTIQITNSAYQLNK